MKNDLSNCKIGDWIWSIQRGWEVIIKIDCFATYQIQTASTDFTFNGFYVLGDVAPSAFTEPPECFNAESPCEFEVGDKVLVSDDLE